MTEYSPIFLSVKVGNFSETDLVCALDELLEQFQSGHTPLDAEKIARAVDWAQSKFGSKPL